MNEVNCALPFNYIENAINIRLRRLSFSTFQHRFKLKLMSLSLGLVPCHSLIWKKMHTYLNSAKNILIMKILCLFFLSFYISSQIIHLILNFILFFLQIFWQKQWPKIHTFRILCDFINSTEIAKNKEN